MDTGAINLDNNLFVVREGKKNDFLALKSDKKALERIFKMAKEINKNCTYEE